MKIVTYDIDIRDIRMSLISMLMIQTAIECQILERPTQRLLISRTIETEAKKAHKPGAISPCCAVDHW